MENVKVIQSKNAKSPNYIWIIIVCIFVGAFVIAWMMGFFESSYELKNGYYFNKSSKNYIKIKDGKWSLYQYLGKYYKKNNEGKYSIKDNEIKLTIGGESMSCDVDSENSITCSDVNYKYVKNPKIEMPPEDVEFKVKLKDKEYDCSRSPETTIFASIASCIETEEEDTLVVTPASKMGVDLPKGWWVITDSLGSKVYGGPYRLFRNGKLVTSNVKIGNDIKTLEFTD